MSSIKRRIRKFHVVAFECDVLLMIYWSSRCCLCPGFLRSLLIDIQEQNIQALVAHSLYIYINVIKLWEYRNICIIGWTIIRCILGVSTPWPPRIHECTVGFGSITSRCSSNAPAVLFFERIVDQPSKRCKRALAYSTRVLHKCGYR